MRTTLELPDTLFRKIKAKAAMEGITLKRLLTLYVENGLEMPLPYRDLLAGASCQSLNAAATASFRI
jgi:hypothetical protein